MRPATPSTTAHVDDNYSWYVLGLLTLTYTIAFIDRQVLNLLVDPIKQSFGLSDTRVSLLQGLAFMSAYVALGPLFGRWTDLGKRRNILVFGATVWSLFTAACGLAKSFGTLFGARMGVGAAEACLTPASWSIISDYFSRERLARALSIFLMAPYLGGGLALVFGGLALQWIERSGSPNLPLLEGLEPWQLAFVLVALPGFLVAALLFTVREPIRRQTNAVEDAHYTLREIFVFLWARRGFYGSFYLGMSCLVIALYGIPSWAPTWFIRRFGVAPADVGIQYGALVLISGSLGVLSGPTLGAWLAKKRYIDSAFRAAWIASIALVPICCAIPFAPTYGVALALVSCATFCYSLPQAMAATALQMVTPNRMRGMATAVYVFIISVIGLGIAPTLIAFVTDYVLRDERRVGESLGLVCGAAAIAAVVLIARGLEPYRRALGEADARAAG